jgi:hypothetical protein
MMLAAPVLALLACAAGPPRPTALGHGSSTSGLWPRQDVAKASGATPLALTADFAFKSSSSSARLKRAFERYEGIIRDQKTLWTHSPAPQHTSPLSTLEVVVPSTTDLDKVAALGDNESFALSISADTATLHASTFSAVHRGLETFAQLTIRLGDTIVINSTTTNVAGAPKFSYRGIMLDTGRHWEPVGEILHLLDGMAASGLNVLHWHITDTQAWPWNSTAAPALIQGAYRSVRVCAETPFLDPFLAFVPSLSWYTVRFQMRNRIFKRRFCRTWSTNAPISRRSSPTLPIAPFASFQVRKTPLFGAIWC